jgi:PiT family inorganic phosphate transporter
MVVTVLLISFVLAAAWANGANDVSKGVGTLVGSGLATYRRAIVWGAVWTVAGGLAAVVVSSGLVETFRTGLLLEAPAALDRFLLAVAIGVFMWVIVASCTGLPVSTTHAMAGAILGAGLTASGVQAIRWPLVATSVALPLALSPFAAAGVSYLLHAATAGWLSRAAGYCVCLERHRIGLVPVGCAHRASSEAPPAPGVVIDRNTACDRDSVVSGVRLTDGAHWATSAALSFARGMNDNPKIIALGVGSAASAGSGITPVFVAGALAMGAGSWLYGRRVTNTLAEEVAAIDPLEGLSASFVASVLVLAASVAVLPVSTTHVATGAIVGAGLRSGARAVRWDTVRTVALAWLVTLPVAGAGATAAWLAVGVIV